MSDTAWTLALLLATIGISMAPATILALVKEARAKGVFVRALMAVVALNNIACICPFVFAHKAAVMVLDPMAPHGLVAILLAPFQDFFTAALLGGGMGLILIASTRPWWAPCAWRRSR